MYPPGGRERASVFSVLIADDDDAWRSAVRDVLEPKGYSTLLAATGREALSLLETQAVDCLLFDFQMPELDGLQTLTLIRRKWQAIPCIFMTANANDELRRQREALRIFAVLNKPVSCELLTNTVGYALAAASEKNFQTEQRPS